MQLAKNSERPGGLSRRGLMGAGLASLLLPRASASTLDDAKQKLVAAYPEFLEAVAGSGIRWKDGALMDFGSLSMGRAEDIVLAPTLADQMAQPYPRGPIATPPTVDFDPGRFRYLPFFMKMYGSNSAEVERHCGYIDWPFGGLPFRMTRVNGVRSKMSAVIEELSDLPRSYRKYLRRPGGGFNWRRVRDKTILSPHAFGIALDINVENSDYWMWEGRSTHWRNRVPYEIVDIFERHGFIWGGKWYHYDTMHFEYRPELLA